MSKKYKIEEEQTIVVFADIKDLSLNEYIGKKLKMYRNVKGLSQIDMSKFLGLSRASVSNIEGCRQALSIDLLEKICSILGIKSSDILPF